MHLFQVLALSKRNTNAAEIILFLHRLVQVLVEYFKELEEESIRDNFVIIYELMDEMMDFGFPQTTESKILQECVSALTHYVDGHGLNLGRLKVYYTGVVQIGGSSATTYCCYQCCIMAFGGYPIQEERSVLGCN